MAVTIEKPPTTWEEYIYQSAEDLFIFIDDRGGFQLDEETLEDTKKRAPREVKTRERAVTAGDYELLAMQTVLGSVKLAMSSKEHPAQLRAMVTSPGGTTIAGLHELETAGFNGIIMDAIEAATERSKELGK